ncbi:MAG: hypothetical protein ABI333_05430 [bacterium]
MSFRGVALLGFLVLLLLLRLIGCGSSEGSPEPRAPIPTAVPRVRAGACGRPVAPLALWCRYELSRGLARIRLLQPEPTVPAAGWRLYASRRRLPLTALSSAASVPLERPQHAVALAPGDPDLFLRVAALGADGLPVAASASCRVHSRDQLVARIPGGLVFADVTGRRRELLLPGAGWPQEVAEGACVFPLGPLPDGDGVVVAQRGGGAVGLNLAMRHSTAPVRRITTPELDVQRFTVDHATPGILWSARAADGSFSGCRLYRLELPPGAPSRLFQEHLFEGCESLAWSGNGGAVVYVSPGAALLRILREGGAPVAVTLDRIDPQAGGGVDQLAFQDLAGAVVFRYREYDGARWQLARLRLNDVSPWVEWIPEEGGTDVVRFAVASSSLSIASVESGGAGGEGAGQIRLHTVQDGSRIVRELDDPDAVRVEWLPGGDYLLVTSDGGDAMILDPTGEVVSRPEVGPLAPRCWAWGAGLTSQEP